VGVSILSYAGEVRVGAISDRDVVSDPEALIAGFQTEFDTLLALALEKCPPMAELSAKLDDALAALDESLTA
jgi:hypothetical protein